MTTDRSRATWSRKGLAKAHVASVPHKCWAEWKWLAAASMFIRARAGVSMEANRVTPFCSHIEVEPKPIVQLVTWTINSLVLSIDSTMWGYCEASAKLSREHRRDYCCRIVIKRRATD